MFLVPLNSVIAVRGGKRVILDPGVSHEFPADEAKQLIESGTAREAHSGDKIGGALIAPVAASSIAAARRIRDAAPPPNAKEIGAEIAAALKGETAASKPKKAAKQAAESDEDL